MIYADNAATTKLDKEAFESMKSYFQNEYANASQLYSFSKVCRTAIKESREIIGKSINSKASEVIITSGGTESDNWAIRGFVDNHYGKSCRIITSVIEHHAILNVCETMKRYDATVDILDVNHKGEIELDTLKTALESEQEMPTLVSIMMANNEIGTIQNIKELCKITHEYGALFHTDAVQVVGHLPIDVCELNVDLLSASAHKFNGPKGIGFLFVKDGVQLDSIILGGAQEAGRRAGTENVAGIVGMAIALERNVNNLSKNVEHIKSVEKCFFDYLNETDINYIRNGSENTLPGNISVSFLDAEGEMLLHRLDLKGICISTGSACDSVNTQISHVIKAIGVNDKYAKGTIRISFGRENTKKEAIEIVDQLVKILKK